MFSYPNLKFYQITDFNLKQSTWDFYQACGVQNFILPISKLLVYIINPYYSPYYSIATYLLVPKFNS